MASKDKTSESQPVSLTPEVDKSASRRKFIKTAVSTSPVILSLANRPVWGQNCSLSGMLSATHASHHDLNDPCQQVGLGQGCTPGFWKENPKAWKLIGLRPGNCIDDEEDTYYIDADGNKVKSSSEKDYYTVNGCRVKNGCKNYDNTGTTFSEIFGGGYYSETLMQVLQKYPGSLEFHAVGAYLNCLAFPDGYGYTGAYIVEVYQQVVDSGDGNLIAAMHDTLDFLNNRGCPINAHGQIGADD